MYTLSQDYKNDVDIQLIKLLNSIILQFKKVLKFSKNLISFPFLLTIFILIVLLVWLFFSCVCVTSLIKTRKILIQKDVKDANQYQFFLNEQSGLNAIIQIISFNKLFFKILFFPLYLYVIIIKKYVNHIKFLTGKLDVSVCQNTDNLTFIPASKLLQNRCNAYPYLI